MIRRDFYFPSADGINTIHGIEWLPENVKHFKGIIQVAHGLTEQISMYERFAKYFTDRGFIVRGNDHLGHGESVAPGGTRLYLGPKGSWHFASDDLYTCRMLTEKEYGKLPYIMFGFSLGSYLMRDYLIRYGGTLDAAVLVGCLSFPSIATFFGSKIAKILEMFLGDKATPKLIDFFMNESNNKKFKPNETPIDWINEDPEERARLMQDPYCACKPTIGIFRETLYAINFTRKKENVAKMNKNIPVFFISGIDDPVARKGKTITDLVKVFEEVGIKDVHYKLYPGRHRIIFEKVGIKALDYIYDWACSKLKTEDTDAMEKVNPMLAVAEKSLLTLAKAGIKEANTLSGDIVNDISAASIMFGKQNASINDNKDTIDDIKNRFDKVSAEIENIISKEDIKAIIEVGAGFAVRYLKMLNDGSLKSKNIKYIVSDLPAIIIEAKEKYSRYVKEVNTNNFKVCDVTNFESINNLLEGINGKIIVVSENVEDSLYDFEKKIALENLARLFNKCSGYYIRSVSSEGVIVYKDNEVQDKLEIAKKHRFRMRHETIGDETLVRVEGALDSINSPKLLDYIDALEVELNGKKIKIDISKIDYILPAGLLALEHIENKYRDLEYILK